MTSQKLRAVIRAAANERGCRYRITQDGEVHFYGPMPNTNDVGWYFVGWNPEEVAAEIHAGRIV